MVLEATKTGKREGVKRAESELWTVDINVLVEKA